MSKEKLGQIVKEYSKLSKEEKKALMDKKDKKVLKNLKLIEKNVIDSIQKMEADLMKKLEKIANS